MTHVPKTLGIIAGNRSLPLMFAEQARKAGIARLVAVAFEGEEVTGSDDLRSLVQDGSPGDLVTLTVVLRSGERRSIRVELGSNPLPVG